MSISNVSPFDLVLFLIFFSLHFLAVISLPLFFFAHQRGSYMKWLNRCTDNRLRLLNRDIIDFFGVQSSAGFPPYEPVLDFSFTSRKFQEVSRLTLSLFVLVFSFESLGLFISISSSLYLHLLPFSLGDSSVDDLVRLTGHLSCYSALTNC